MIRRSASLRGGRAGLTLTEVLISILIVGVGLISLATLFPLGLMRLRSAMRDSRSTLLAQSAIDEITTRNLLSATTFINPFIVPWYASAAATSALAPPAPNVASYDPWLEDPAGYPFSGLPQLDNGLRRVQRPDLPALPPAANTNGPGLPVCYDPLWRAATANLAGGQGVYNGFPSAAEAPESRFASGVQMVPNNTVGGGYSAAAGLQRITNFDVYYPTRFSYLARIPPLPVPPYTGTIPAGIDPLRVLGPIFASPDDVLYYSAEKSKNPGAYSSLLPDRTGASDQFDNNANGVVDEPGETEAVSDWEFTWFLTGQRADATNPSLVDGDIVICHKRPFALEVPVGTLTTPGFNEAAGERVVQAVWGYGTVVQQFDNNQQFGYALGGDRSVLLRWPTQQGDPEVRTGGWIADVTYVRTAAGQTTHQANAIATAVALLGVGRTFPVYPAQRCHWYQVVQKGPVEDEGNGYRRMVVRVSTPLRARTLLSVANPTSLDQAEAALIMPSVVNVFTKSFTTR